MISQTDLTQFLYQTLGPDLLATAAKKDTVPNSVQIHGKDQVKKVALGVSANLEFFQKALEEEADYCILHHGLHLSGMVVNGRLEPYEDLLRLIFKNDLTVAGFHYALDAHPVLGNNAQIIQALGATLKEPFFDSWGYVAEFAKPQHPSKLAEKCSKLFEHDIFAVYAGPEKINRIGVCSGGAKPHGQTWYEIIDKNIDAFISGEINESGPYMAEAGHYHYFAGGHYATEVFGIQALGQALKKRFKNNLDVVFLDVTSSL